MGLLERWDDRNQAAADRDRSVPPPRIGPGFVVRIATVFVLVFVVGPTLRAQTGGWAWWPGRAGVYLLVGLLLGGLLLLIDRRWGAR